MNTEQDQIRLLTAMAQRLRNDPRFMAHVLAAYQEQEGLDEDGLARDLGALPEMVVRLALCKRPAAGAPDFAEQVRELSDYSLIDEALLACVIERMDRPAVQAQYSGLPAQVLPSNWLTRLLAAARNRAMAIAQRPVPLLASAAGLILFVAAGILLWQAHRKAPDFAKDSPQPATTSTATAPRGVTASASPAIEPSATPHPPASRPGPADLLAQVSVNLGERPSLRGAGEAGAGGQAIRLPRSRVRLTLKLPETYTRGRYNISIVDAYGQPLVTRRAYSADGRILGAILDLRGLEEEGNRLRVSRAGEAPYDYPVIISDSKTSRR